MPQIIILAIESSCDDTSAAVLVDGKILSNVVYTQKIHEEFGGVVPELASRKHEQKIVPVVAKALSDAGVNKNDLTAIAFTRGPGLIGSLLVGVCFAKSMALALGIPIIEVNHMQAHILSNFIDQPDLELPFICFTVSGGHTQLVLVRSPFDMELLGTTIDDAAGEAFDKAAKMLQLDYPGGPMIDKFAKEGDAKKFNFAKPRMGNYNFSFSGLKTSILYFLQKQTKENPNFIEENKLDLCASIQRTIVDILMDKFEKAIVEFKVNQIAIAGGVSANSRFRQSTLDLAAKYKIKANIPSFQYCTDNAGMIAIAAYFKYQKQDFSTQDVEPLVRGYSL
jgi:N6-L-threonylcarbamoyladenine synthase